MSRLVALALVLGGSIALAGCSDFMPWSSQVGSKGGATTPIIPSGIFDGRTPTPTVATTPVDPTPTPAPPTQTTPTEPTPVEPSPCDNPYDTTCDEGETKRQPEVERLDGTYRYEDVDGNWAEYTFSTDGTFYAELYLVFYDSSDFLRGKYDLASGQLSYEDGSNGTISVLDARNVEIDGQEFYRV